MMHLQFARFFSIFLFFGLITQSCTEPQPLSPAIDEGDRITYRTILHDSIFEQHNDFIMWLSDNHEDSSNYYADDFEDFMDFAVRKRKAWDGVSATISTLITGGDTLLIFYGDTLEYNYPAYIKNSGFVIENDL